MSLTLLTGLPGSGATASLIAAVTEAASAGRRSLLITPSSEHAVRLRAEIAAVTPLGVRIASFDRMIEAEWLLKGDGRRIVPALHREVLLARALVSSQVAERPGPGAISLLGTLVSRAIASGVDTGSASPPGLAGKLTRSLRAYLEALAAAGLVEPGEATRLLANLDPPAHTVGFASFTALTPDRVELVRGWDRAGSEIILALPWRSGCAGTQPVDGLVEQLSGMGAVTIESPAPPSEGPDELARIATDLFAAGSPAPSQGAVSLGVAQGDESEARLIAARVAGLLADGVPADRVAVSFSDPVRHKGWLARAFDDAAVAAVWDVRTPVRETPLGRAMLRMWSLASSPMKREDFAALLRSPFSGVDAARADRADVTWRSQRVRGRGLSSLAGGAGRLVAGAEEVADLSITDRTAKKWKSIADTMIANAHGGSAPVAGTDGALDAAVHRAFCQILTSAASEPGVRISAREVWSAFAAASVSPASEGVGDGVLVTSTRRMVLRDFDAVIIGGLNAGETPRQGSDDRLEGEAVRSAMSAFGIDSDPEEHARAERLVFYLAVTSARSSLTLCRRASDDEGRQLRPSIFWDEFLDLYRRPGAETESCDGLPPESRSGPGAPASRHGGRCAVRGLLSDERSLRLLADIDSVTPGEVEQYTACPYRWFVERKLRPRTPDVTVDRAVAGQVAHAALAEFYRDRSAGPGDHRVDPGSVGPAADRAREIVRISIAGAPAPTTLEEEWLLASIEPSVVSLIERDAAFLPGYQPTEFEWSFGLPGDEPVDLGGVSVRGRADRIDIGPQGLVVIDYKRTHAASLSQIRAGGLVQLQLYCLAASQRLGKPIAGGLYRSLSGAGDRGFVLEGVPGCHAAADVIDADEMRALLDEAVAVAREALSGMQAGRIDPTPSQGCRYCSALPFCPKGARS